MPTSKGGTSTLTNWAGTSHAQEEYASTLKATYQFRDTCRKCGARRVDRQLGLEASPSAYVAAMVRVFREVKRVLHTSGTLWLNCGDSYASQGGERKYGSSDGATGRGDQPGPRISPNGLKPKDMIGVPWMLAFALRDDGWYLRDPIVWAKSEVDEDDNLEGSAMPGSQRDRCTSAYELVFMLSKRARYYYDPEACKTKSGAMLRNVWRINPEPTKHKHYATYPRELVRRCVLLGSSSKGVCPECLAPWDRVVEREFQPQAYEAQKYAIDPVLHRTKRNLGARYQAQLDANPAKTLGWRPGCAHGHDPIPALICDPFAGSCTSGVVATALGRRFVGMDLSREYLTDQAMRRLERPHATPIRPAREEHFPLFGGAAP